MTKTYKLSETQKLKHKLKKENDKMRCEIAEIEYMTDLKERNSVLKKSLKELKNK